MLGRRSPRTPRSSGRGPSGGTGGPRRRRCRARTPVDSQMSSAAAKRTSTGNDTRSSCGRPRRRSSRSTGRRRARGTAYSLSRNRTRRARRRRPAARASVNSRAVSARATSRLMPGDQPRDARPDRLAPRRRRVGEQLVVQASAPNAPAGRPRRRREPVVALGQRGRCAGTRRTRSGRCASARSSNYSSSSVERHRPSTACSRKAGTHCRVTSVTTPSAPRPTRAAANSSGRSVGRAVDDASRRRARARARGPGSAMPAEARAGAVRAGGDRAGDGLPVDVAEVLQGEPGRRSSRVEHVQRWSRRDRDQAARRGRREDAGQPVEPQLHARRWRRAAVNEWPAPSGLTRRPALGRRGHHRRTTSTDVGRVGDLRGARRVTLPAQLRQCRRYGHPKFFPSPR